MQYIDVLTQVVDQASEKPDPWWTVIAGIIAVPAAILGLIYTSALIKKTRLESHKVELEISEKKEQAEEAEAHPDVRNLTKVVAAPLIEGRRVQELLLRFVVLYLVLSAWSIVRELFRIIQLGIPIELGESVLNGTATGIGIVLIVCIMILQELPSVGYYIVLFGLGIPILADALEQLHIKRPALLSLLQTKYSLIAVGLVVLIAGATPNIMSMFRAAGL